MLGPGTARPASHLATDLNRFGFLWGIYRFAANKLQAELRHPNLGPRTVQLHARRFSRGVLTADSDHAWAQRGGRVRPTSRRPHPSDEFGNSFGRPARPVRWMWQSTWEIGCELPHSSRLNEPGARWIRQFIAGAGPGGAADCLSHRPAGRLSRSDGHYPSRRPPRHPSRRPPHYPRPRPQRWPPDYGACARRR